MSDPTPKAVLSAIAEDGQRGPLARPLLVARVIAICFAAAGAFPTAMTLYQSWSHGIPYSEVPHRLAQYDLWVKNVECKVEYKALNTTQGTRIDVGACPKSGDIAIKISSQGKAAYEWIPFDKLQRSTAHAGLLDLIIPPAMADTAPPMPAPHAARTPGVRLVQSGGMQVICQALQGKTQIVRIVNDGGKCYREIISGYQGQVEKREEVPCHGGPHASRPSPAQAPSGPGRTPHPSC